MVGASLHGRTTMEVVTILVVFVMVVYSSCDLCHHRGGRGMVYHIACCGGGGVVIVGMVEVVMYVLWLRLW